MPFTGSHPAAVLPLLGTPLSASALVLGSTAPDLPYYLPVPLDLHTHTALGVGSSDVLLGLVAYVVWHGLLAAPALAAAPDGVRARLAGRVEPGLRVRLSGPRAAVLVLLGLAVGAATHVGWDEFTHPGRFGTQHLPVLAAQHGGTPGWQWAQYASGLVGALLLLVWALRWWRRTRVVPVPAGRAALVVWPGLVLLGVLAGGAAALTDGDPSLAGLGYVGATRGAAAVAVVAAVLATGWHLAPASSRTR